MPDDNKQADSGTGYGYGKSGMPMWTKVLLYLVIGGVVYYAAYMAWQAKHPASGNPYGAGTNTSTVPTGSGGAGGSLYNY